MRAKYLMGSGPIRRIGFGSGGGCGGVVTAVTELAHFPVNGARQVIYSKRRIARSVENDPERSRVVSDIVERLRLKRLAEGDPWPAQEAIAA